MGVQRGLGLPSRPAAFLLSQDNSETENQASCQARGQEKVTMKISPIGAWKRDLGWGKERNRWRRERDSNLQMQNKWVPGVKRTVCGLSSRTMYYPACGQHTSHSQCLYSCRVVLHFPSSFLSVPALTAGRTYSGVFVSSSGGSLDSVDPSTPPESSYLFQPASDLPHFFKVLEVSRIQKDISGHPNI